MRLKSTKEVILDMFFPTEARDSFWKHFFLTFRKLKSRNNAKEKRIK